MSTKGIFFNRNIAAAVLLSAGLVFTVTGCGEKKEKAPDTGSAAQPVAVAQAPAALQSASNQAAPMTAPMDAKHAIGQKPEGHPPVDASDVSKHQVAHAGLKGQKEVRLSDAVKSKWKDAKVKVVDNVSKQSSVISLKVGSSVDLGKDGFKLKLDAVVPDYAMTATTIETRSNEARNPAVLITLYSGDKAVTKGWIFKTMTDFNSFKSDRFGVELEAPALKLK
ncbi:hypothetical protein EPN18_07805 [bacterium]|nr:MAG: hypothetical protein EPN18_07805 [bacterium]